MFYWALCGFYRSLKLPYRLPLMLPSCFYFCFLWMGLKMDSHLTCKHLCSSPARTVLTNGYLIWIHYHWCRLEGDVPSLLSSELLHEHIRVLNHYSLWLCLAGWSILASPFAGLGWACLGPGFGFWCLKMILPSILAIHPSYHHLYSREEVLHRWNDSNSSAFIWFSTSFVSSFRKYYVHQW